MKVFEALVEAFALEGVETVFGLMGDANMLFMTAASEYQGMRVIHARHESAAVTMTAGYAEVTGKVGACTVTVGPGLTQIATQLVCARQQRSPLVVLAGDTPIAAPYHLQQFDPAPFAVSLDVPLVPIRSLARVADAVRDAFFQARTGSRPVILSVPQDVQEWELTAGFDYQSSVGLAPPARPLHPIHQDVEAIANRLASAKSPVIVAGRGAVVADAHGGLVELSLRIGAHLATTLRAKDWFDDEPNSIGIAGWFATPSSRHHLSTADCVLAVGARMGRFTSVGNTLFPQAHVIRIDTNPVGMVEGVQTADSFLLGDARLGVDALNLALDDRGYAQGDPPSVVALPSDSVSRQVDLEPGLLDPRDVIQVVQSRVPDDWLFVIGFGHFWHFAIGGLAGRSPSSYQYTLDFGAIGHGLPAAIGAALGAPERKVVLIEGDGGILMNIQELETIARHNVPVLALVLNDGAYSAEVHKLRARGFSEREAVFGMPDFASIAAGFGVEATRPDKASDLAAVIDHFATSPRPMLADLRVSRRVVSDQYLRLYGTHDG